MEEAIKKHHWKGLQPRPDKYFGFIYLIEEKYTKRYYIGKRQYWVSSRKVKKNSLRPNREVGTWEPKHWRPSNWEFYTSSSKELNEKIKEKANRHTYTIIGQYTCKADLVYAEAKAQMDMDCMTKRNKRGDRLSYNKQVAAIRFIPPCLKKEQL